MIFYGGKSGTVIKNKTGNNRRRYKNTTRRLRRSASDIAAVFMEMLMTIKLFHWNTRSYALHKATDELYAKLNEHMDSFVEVMVGKDSDNVQLVVEKLKLSSDANKNNIKQRIYDFRSVLNEMSFYFDADVDQDLLSIRDDILADINQFLYLMNFN